MKGCQRKTSFLNHQCEQLCQIMDDEDAYNKEIFRKVWDFLKKENSLV